MVENKKNVPRGRLFYEKACYLEGLISQSAFMPAATTRL